MILQEDEIIMLLIIEILPFKSFIIGRDNNELIENKISNVFLFL